ncbi:hypothetical protein [Flavobacterium oreochromis]|uniref:Uncharacterized protein n=2 Tax=Flavobacterium TaxID=237 RepID=A0A246G9J2_9FLAO|nr:hypothetical protein [Flavobacterium oreochromis]OWP76310.1 hypothetical protein BWK62_09990 [Flavobacterium oreochromis]POR23892.1 hypothetical protein BWK58_09750 [Flavobacterium columnare]
MYKKVIAISSLSFIMSNCNNHKEDIVNEVDKEGSIETEMTIEHMTDEKDLVITKHKVWIKGTLLKEVIHKDTISALGEYEEEDENGEKMKGKKEYEIYFTAK